MRKDFVTWNIYEYVLTTYDGIFDDIFSRLDHNHKCSLMEYSAWDFTFNHRWSSRKVRKIQASKPCGWNHTQIKIWLSENMVPLNPMVNDHFPHKQWPFRRVFSPCIQDPYENWTSTKPWDLSPILTIKGEDFQRFFSWQNRQFHGQLPSLFVVKPILVVTYYLSIWGWLLLILQALQALLKKTGQLWQGRLRDRSISSVALPRSLAKTSKNIGQSISWGAVEAINNNYITVDIYI